MQNSCSKTRQQTETETEISAKSAMPVCLLPPTLPIVLYVQTGNRAVQQHRFRR